MSGPSNDEFADAMWQHMEKVNRAMTAKLNELRRENRQLAQELAEAKDRVYVVQDQLWQVVDELARRRKEQQP